MKTYRQSFEESKGNARGCVMTVVPIQTPLLADRIHMDHSLETIRKIPVRREGTHEQGD